jgi:hypothetical protein
MRIARGRDAPIVSRALAPGPAVEAEAEEAEAEVVEAAVVEVVEVEDQTGSSCK